MAGAVRITQIDGKLPNLALMQIAHWHRARGDAVVFREVKRFGRRLVGLTRDLHDLEHYDAVYGSAIFSESAPLVARFQKAWPGAVVGGTWTDATNVTVAQHFGLPCGDDYEHFDYSIYPNFKASIGFTQRGCRLKCGFCGVHRKEGVNRSVNTIADIWRGGKHPKRLHLLDNDFFGQPEWRERVKEIREGGFKVCLNQGINVRLVDDEAAEALASLEYRDSKFKERRLYTAWDNIGHERIFFEGVDRLERAGIRLDQVMAYMLVGYDPAETWDRIMYRFDRMVDRGIEPYPMVFDPARGDLKAFQKWAVMGFYRIVPWAEFRDPRKGAAAARPASAHHPEFDFKEGERA